MSAPDLLPVWIGAQRVAEITGFSRVKVWRLANAGKLPAYRPRGVRSWRFRSDDIQRWIEEGFNGPTLS